MSDNHGWNHPQCYPCWFKRWGLTREPVRFRQGEDVKNCCYCGRPTGSGIYIRERPGSAVIPHCPDQTLDLSIFRRPASGSSS
jgi:hypothetical protein